ncbi:MAG: hypothetical protein JWM74_4100 [Myxococcaceae bacterium]|nr:hypothetical protein [Myxococcaceae bacterium]
MAKVGRNDPCPCKSGKKYKPCHLLAEQGVAAESSRAMRLHELDRELVDGLLDCAVAAFGKGWFPNILDDLGIEELDPALAAFVIPCSVYEWASEDGTVLDILLGSTRIDLTARERGWLEAQQRSWLSVWEITDVTPGVAVSVRDLFTGKERRVLEQGASRSLMLRESVLARVVDFEGVSVFCGMHGRTLAPSLAADLVTAIRRGAGFRSKKGTAARLRANVPFEDMFLAWEDFVEAADAAMMHVPVLQNSDGDPLLLTRDHFEFDPAHRAAIDAKLAELAEDDEARPNERAFTFHRAGNAVHKTWESAIVGRAVSSKRALVLESNSIHRADDLRTKVEAALGPLVRHRAREHHDPEAMLAAARDPRGRSTAREAYEPPPPEALEALRAIKQRHYEEWLDIPVPALSGLTPREAATKPRKRKQLVLLLKEFENQESRVPPAERFDFSGLWTALELGEHRR